MITAEKTEKGFLHVGWEKEKVLLFSRVFFLCLLVVAFLPDHVSCCLFISAMLILC